MNELYWITRFDSICGFLFAIVIIFGFLALVFGVGYFVHLDTDEETKISILRNRTIKNLTIAIIFGIVLAFIPSTKEALVIYGVGGTIDYVKSDSTVKQLPKKAILALDKYLNEITDDKN